MEIDLRVAQLLCSRLCHDVVGAAGAVGTGLELIEDMGLGAEDSESAFAMTVNSAKQLSARLAFFRMAFGSGGGRAGPPLRDAADLARAYLAEHGITLDWPTSFDGVDSADISVDAARLGLNLVLLAKESLLRGGAISMHLATIDGRIGMAVTASGNRAQIKEANREALNPSYPVEQLTPHTVQAYATACLGGALGGGVEVDGAVDEVRLAVLLNAA